MLLEPAVKGLRIESDGKCVSGEERERWGKDFINCAGGKEEGKDRCGRAEEG